jgi:hypothetical protein
VTDADYTEPRWYTEIKYWQSVDYRDGYAYVIRAGDNGPIKIGKAMDPEARRGELQTGSFLPLTILHVLPGYGQTEKDLQHRLKDSCIGGEWFDGPAIPGFLRWLPGESERMMEAYEAAGVLPRKGSRTRKHYGGKVEGNFFRRGMNRAWRVKPDRDAPVTVRFVDPSELEPPKGKLPSRYGNRNDLMDEAA